MEKYFLWDTHCHLYQEYYENIANVVKESLENNVTHFIVSGCDSKSNMEAMYFISKYDNSFATVGIHPEEASHYQEKDLVLLEKFLEESKVIGIGEIGLDYHFVKDNKEEQKKLFEYQLSLAKKYHLPVVIHSRDATEDTINILKKYHVKGIIHSFSGSLETAKIYIKLGFYLGINGVVTFKNSNLKNILSEIFPFIVLETDSPYLTPHPYRGQKNHPKYIRNIAEFIASELNIEMSQVVKVTNENVLSVFDKL